MKIRIAFAWTALVALFNTSGLFAADIVWTNLAGGNWNNPTNWSPNQVPGATDHARITNAGTYTVTVNVAATVANLTVGGSSGTQTVAQANSSLTLNGPSFFATNTVFVLSYPGVLDGTGEVNFAGTLNWEGGFMSGSGKTTVTNGAVLTMNTGNFHRYLQRNFDLRGNGTFNYGGYYLYGGNGANLTIFGGASFDLANNAQLAYQAVGNSQYAVIQNYGNLRKTSGTGISSVDWIVNNNAAFIQSQAGILSLDHGGIAAGSYDAAGSGAVVNFGDQTHWVTNGVNFTASGGGLLRCNGGTLSVDIPYTINPTFELVYPGVLGGNADVNFTSTLNWEGGFMSGSGKTTVTNGAVLTMNTGNYHRYLRRNFDLRGNGTFNYGGYSLFGANGALLTIFNGGTFDLLNGAQLAYEAVGNSQYASIVNQGSFRKTTGVATANINWSMTNSATVDSQAGTLDFQRTYRQESGQTLLSGGNYQAVLLDINGGSLEGGGIITGPVRNNGYVRPGAPFSALAVTNANNFSNTAAGTFFVQLGGSNAGVTHDLMRVGGSALLNGTVSISYTNGYIPAPGTVHTVMTYTAKSGVFSNSNAQLLGLKELYTNNTYLLIADNAVPGTSVTSPLDNARLCICEPFVFAATANDIDGTVTNVDLLVNSVLVASFTNTPYAVVLTNDAAGVYTFQSVARDNEGGERLSETVTVTFGGKGGTNVLSLYQHPTNLIKFCLEGEVGRDYEIEAKPKITNADPWTVIGTVTPSNGIWRLFVGDLTNFNERYYRAIRLPREP